MQQRVGGLGQTSSSPRGRRMLNESAQKVNCCLSHATSSGKTAPCYGLWKRTILQVVVLLSCVFRNSRISCVARSRSLADRWQRRERGQTNSPHGGSGGLAVSERAVSTGMIPRKPTCSVFLKF